MGLKSTEWPNQGHRLLATGDILPLTSPHPRIGALMKRLLIGIALSLALATSAGASVPVWGAKTSSPADTPPAELKPGEWIWGGRPVGAGPMAVIVSLTEQRAY